MRVGGAGRLSSSRRSLRSALRKGGDGPIISGEPTRFRVGSMQTHRACVGGERLQSHAREEMTARTLSPAKCQNW